MKTTAIRTNSLLLVLLLGVLSLLSWLFLPGSSGQVLTLIFGSTFAVCAVILVLKQRR